MASEHGHSLASGQSPCEQLLLFQWDEAHVSHIACGYMWSHVMSLKFCCAALGTLVPSVLADQGRLTVNFWGRHSGPAQSVFV